MKTLVLLTACFLATAATGTELSGTAKETDGTPIKGATVKISTARLRTGASPMCPSCWPDCVKSARTDAAGAFRIPNINERLVFKVLVLAEGHGPKLLADVDPQQGSMQVTLERRDLAAFPPEQLIQGRVTGADHKPVAGAMVFPEYSSGVDPMALTDAEGRFVLASKKRMHRNQLRIRAEGYAVTNVQVYVKQGLAKPVEVTLSRGVTIRGRVMAQGKPVSGADVGTVQMNRSIERFLGDVEVTTREDGTFVFHHVPAREKMAVYGLMDSLGERGAVQVRRFETGDQESVCDLGDLELRKARHVAGRFVLPDGRKFPEGTRISIGRRVAWDSRMVEVAPDGRFAAGGFPEGETLEIGTPLERDVQKVNHGLKMDARHEYVFVGHQGEFTDLEIELGAKDSKARLEEENRKIVRENYDPYFRLARLSPEKIEAFVSAKRKQDDRTRAWTGDSPGSWKANADEAEKVFAREMKPALGEEALGKYLDYEAQDIGRSMVEELMKRRPGDWLTAVEKEALVRAISSDGHAYSATLAGKDMEAMSLEEKLAECEAEFACFVGAAARVLPPEKVVIVRELLEAGKQQELAAIRRNEGG